MRTTPARNAERRAGLKVAKIDIDESPGVAKRYGVRSAPTVLLFRGGEKAAQHVGLTNKETLLRLLEI